MTFVQKTLKASGLMFELVAPLDLSSIDCEMPATRGSSDIVAVVGMGGRFPDNDTIEGF